MAHEFRTTRRVAFSETDMAGIVHFANFFRYMEDAEHEFLRSLGLAVHLEHEGQVISFPRVAASCDYSAPAYFGDELDVRLRVLKKGSRSLTFGFEFWRMDKKIATGEVTTACCVVHRGHKPGESSRLRAVQIPKPVAEKIQAAPESGS